MLTVWASVREQSFYIRHYSATIRHSVFYVNDMTYVNDDYMNDLYRHWCGFGMSCHCHAQVISIAICIFSDVIQLLTLNYLSFSLLSALRLWCSTRGCVCHLL